MLKGNLNNQYLSWLQKTNLSDIAKSWINKDFKESNRSLIYDLVYNKFKIIQFLSENNLHLGFYGIINDSNEISFVHEISTNEVEQIFNFSASEYNIEFLIYLCSLYSESDTSVNFAMDQFFKGKIFNDIEMDFIRSKINEISTFSIEHGFLKTKSYYDIINPYISMITTAGKTIKFKPHKVDLSNDGLNSIWRTNDGKHIQLYEIFDLLSIENLKSTKPATV